MKTHIGQVFHEAPHEKHSIRKDCFGCTKEVMDKLGYSLSLRGIFVCLGQRVEGMTRYGDATMIFFYYTLILPWVVDLPFFDS